MICAQTHTHRYKQNNHVYYRIEHAGHNSKSGWPVIGRVSLSVLYFFCLLKKHVKTLQYSFCLLKKHVKTLQE